MKSVEIYTDGACSGNPGAGGWAAVLRYEGESGTKEKQLFGKAAKTTNNRMELAAAVYGLKALNRPCEVKLYSDSAYLVNAMTQGWIASWQERGWKTADGKPVKNKEIWEELLRVAEGHQIEWIKVEAHADNEGNNLADTLAYSMAYESFTDVVLDDDDIKKIDDLTNGVA